MLRLDFEIARIPFPDEKFDAVLAVEVLEHIIKEDLDAGIKEVKRVLKNGGLFIVTTPYKESPRIELCPDCHAVFPHMQHLRAFDEKNLANLISKNGLRIRKMEPISFVVGAGPGIAKTLKFKARRAVLNRLRIGRRTLFAIAEKSP